MNDIKHLKNEEEITHETYVKTVSRYLKVCLKCRT